MTSIGLACLTPRNSIETNSCGSLAEALVVGRMVKLGLTDSPSDREVHSTGLTNFVAAAPRLNILTTKAGFNDSSFGDVHSIGTTNSGGWFSTSDWGSCAACCLSSPCMVSLSFSAPLLQSAT